MLVGYTLLIPWITNFRLTNEDVSEVFLHKKLSNFNYLHCIAPLLWFICLWIRGKPPIDLCCKFPIDLQPNFDILSVTQVPAVVYKQSPSWNSCIIAHRFTVLKASKRLIILLLVCISFPLFVPNLATNPNITSVWVLLNFQAVDRAAPTLWKTYDLDSKITFSLWQFKCIASPTLTPTLLLSHKTITFEFY